MFEVFGSTDLIVGKGDWSKWCGRGSSGIYRSRRGQVTHETPQGLVFHAFEGVPRPRGCLALEDGVLCSVFVDYRVGH